MSEVSHTARQVRQYILDTFVTSGRAPSLGEIMLTQNLSRVLILKLFEEIASIDAFCVEAGTENIRLLGPFSNIGTPYRISVDGAQKWYATGALDALSIGVCFPGLPITLDTHCRDCGKPIRLVMRNQEILSQDPRTLLVHLGLPIARWHDNWPAAFEHMNLMRTPADAQVWELMHPGLESQSLPFEKAYALAKFINQDRLSYDYTHPHPAGTLGAYLRTLGLIGPWWRLG